MSKNQKVPKRLKNQEQESSSEYQVSEQPLPLSNRKVATNKYLDDSVQSAPKFSAAQLKKQEYAQLEEKIQDVVIDRDMKRKLQETFMSWRNIEKYQVALSMCGLLIAIISYEVDLFYGGYKGITTLHDDGPNSAALIQKAIKDRQNSPCTHQMKLINLSLSVVTILLLIYRQSVKVGWVNTYFRKVLYAEESAECVSEFKMVDFEDDPTQNEGGGYLGDYSIDEEEKAFENKMTNLVDSSIDRKPFWSKKLVAKIFVQLIFPWPWVECIFFMPQLVSSHVKHVPYYLSDMIMVIMFMRVYEVCRLYERYHEYRNVNSKAILRKFGVESGRMFTMKCELYFNSNTFIVILFSLSVTILAFILRVFELPFEQSATQKSLLGYKCNIHDFGSAIWLTAITITTVGYGDIWPHTVGGQLTCVTIALWGAFVVSLLIMVTTQVFDFNKKEQQAVFRIKQTKAASISVIYALKFFVQKKKYYAHRIHDDIDFDKKSTFLMLIKKYSGDVKVRNRVSREKMTLVEIVKHNVTKRQTLIKQGQTRQLETLRAKVGKAKNREQYLEGLEMNKAWKELLETLDQVNEDRERFESTQDEAETEQLQSIRIIKKEVIDMADLMDKMAGLIVKQHRKIAQQSLSLKVIRSHIKGETTAVYQNYIAPDQIVEARKKRDWNYLPLLFSLRRSPFYQKKIEQRQLSNELLMTREILMKKVTDKAKCEYDINKCLDTKEFQDDD